MGELCMQYSQFSFKRTDFLHYKKKTRITAYALLKHEVHENLIGFMEVSNTKLDILFIHHDCREKEEVKR